MAKNAGLIELADLDDHNENDQNYYLVSNNSNNDKSQFINSLAFYISTICEDGIDASQKKKIYELIDDFSLHRDPTIISPYLEKLEK